MSILPPRRMDGILNFGRAVVPARVPVQPPSDSLDPCLFPFLGPTGRVRPSNFPLIGVSFICWVRLGTLTFRERKHPVEGPIKVGTAWGWTKRKWRIFSSIEPLSHHRIGKGWLDRGARVAHLQHGMVWILPRLAEKVRERCSRLESERNTLDGGVKSKGGDA